jgi:hypothetical protein
MKDISNNEKNKIRGTLRNKNSLSYSNILQDRGKACSFIRIRNLYNKRKYKRVFPVQNEFPEINRRSEK